jgi:hypothetical protein
MFYIKSNQEYNKERSKLWEENDGKIKNLEC